MMIEITLEEYRNLQRIKMKNELLLKALMKHATLDYYAEHLEFDDDHTAEVLQLLFEDDYLDKFEKLLKDKKKKQEEAEKLINRMKQEGAEDQ